MTLLSGFENESVIRQQGHRIGHQFVPLRVAQFQRWLRVAGCLLLSDEVRHIRGPIRAGRCGFLQRIGHHVRSILANQFQQLRDLACQRAVRLRHAPKISFDQHAGTQAVQGIEQALLRFGAPRRWSLLDQQFFKTLGPEGLSPPPGTGITNNFLQPMVNSHRTGIGFHSEPLPDITRRHAVLIAVKLQAQVFVDERLGGVAVVVDQQG